jgi:hypothetical protein
LPQRIQGFATEGTEETPETVVMPCRHDGVCKLRASQRNAVDASVFDSSLCPLWQKNVVYSVARNIASRLAAAGRGG